MRPFTIPACALALVLALTACLDPVDRRPGLRLTGELVENATGDWAFTNEFPEIAIETRPLWLVPHSVTIVCAAADGRFFVGARNPDTKRWVGHVDRDPEVRLKIGERVYEQRLAVLDDPADIQAARRAYAAKYGWPVTPPDDAPPLRYFEVLARN